MTYILWLVIVLYIVIIYLITRNELVSRYRRLILDYLAALNMKDIDSITPKNRIKMLERCQKRWREYDQVSYDDMIYKFWKPLRLFYKGRDFNIE